MAAGENPNYLVKTVGELDLLVNKQLVKIGAAEKPAKGETSYKILDREKAKSSNIMPKVLNPLGKKGWNLTAVNKMECYIFTLGDPVEYMIYTPADLDRYSIDCLQKSGALKLSGFEGETPTLEVTDAKQAKIQNVLPTVLGLLKQENWHLCAINGPQLYFFTRPIK